MFILNFFLHLQRENDSGGRQPPYFMHCHEYKVMKISDIIDAIGNEIVARGLYLIEVSVNKDNEVEVVIEAEEGIVDLEDCVAISRHFETCFDREVEDYSLTVTSAGLDQPFKILKQYQKAVGSKVEVQLKGGKKMVATLTAADQESITLNYTAKEAVDGKKKKELVEHNDRFTMDQVNSVRPYIEF